MYQRKGQIHQKNINIDDKGFSINENQNIAVEEDLDEILTSSNQKNLKDNELENKLFYTGAAEYYLTNYQKAI